MIQFTLVYLLLLLIGMIVQKLTKHKPRALYCGIFGFAGIPGKRVNIKKIATLGVFNIERGTDNCGYYWSGNIAKGVGETANWRNFIDKNDLTRGDLNGDIFLGHTRKTTCGGNVEESAHPHVVGNYVQTHNGSLKNHWALGRAHDIDTLPIKVDSIVLASIIAKDGFGVLKEYEGAAALAFTFMDDSNTMYLYHGASRDAVGSKIWEERPLFFLMQPEGIYYSSIPESLNFISTNKERARCLAYNRVFKITDGAFDENFDYEVGREDVNIPKYLGYKNTAAYNACQVGEKNVDAGSAGSNSPIYDTIMSECAPENLHTGLVCYRYGRFYRNGGLLHGQYVIDRKGRIQAKDTRLVGGIERYFFVRGIMMKSIDDYCKLLPDIKNWVADKEVDFSRTISKYSKYPIVSLTNEGKYKHASLNFWYKDSQLFNGSLQTVFNTRIYDIKNGVLKSIKDPTKPNERMLYQWISDLVPTLDDSGVLFTPETLKITEEGAASEKEPVTPVININQPRIKSSVGRMVALIKGSIDAVVKNKDQAKQLPEVFLLFVDEWNKKVFGSDVDNLIIEEATTSTLRDMIETGCTFREHAMASGEDETSFGLLKIKELMACYQEDQILQFKNRYLTTDFDSNVYNEVVKDKDTAKQAELEFPITDAEEAALDFAQQKAEFSELLQKAKDQYKSLVELADKMQPFAELETAQSLAYEIYVAEKPIMKVIETAALELELPF